MKTSLLYLVFLLYTNYIFCQIYEIKSCKIDFEYRTPMFKGKKTLIFADSGRIEKLVTEQSIDTLKMQELNPTNFGGRSKIHVIQIQTKDSVFSVDLDLMTGSSRERIRVGPDMTTLAAKMNTKIGVDTFLNRKCDIVDFHGLKLWYWKGVVLKKQFPEESGASVSEYATSIDENYNLKDDEFKVPSGAKMN